MNKFEEKLGGFLVEFVEKPEENRVFMAARRIPRQGQLQTALSKDEELAAVSLGKEWFEQNRGVMLLNFHKDPLAGGMRAQVPPKGQLYKSGVRRQVHYATAPNGTMVYQGRVGEVEAEVESNIERGNNIMIATAMWTGEWI